MDDYIKREDVLKLFCGTCLWENDCFGNNGDEPCERYKIISSLPTYDIESKWILAKDALPKEDGVYFFVLQISWRIGCWSRIL